MRGNNNNTRSRLFGNRAGSPNARPDPGRGSIMSGSRAQDIHRRREDRHNVGGQRGPQVARSLVDRITFDRGGRSGGRGRGHNRHQAQGAARHGDRGQGGNPRPLVDRITGGNGAGRVGTQAAGHNVAIASTDTTTHGNGFDTNSNVAFRVTPQQSQVASEVGAREPALPFDPLFDEPTRQEPQVPQAPVPVRVTAHTPGARTVVDTQRTRPARVAKKPGHFIKNAKLRGILLGTRPRQVKRHDAMLLRVAETTKSLQGHELTCASPAHSNVDGYGDGDAVQE
ncbi:hypothetical protein P171DRAFT_439929 [Karstenula rhodostoma CBS 690.94]|uniref:Uncharacterized protein n=1 Tax=Karstenula rhodostoma CBS 690.94 TaxID=1392251 RepID=A0A9P4PUB4_9PLEO|nr:hypothetical protein P171DRAFT_439929 [Karstenula rhodostoma CBS 690.94]